MSPSNTLFSVCSMIAFLLVWIPLPQRNPLHNIGIYLFITWTATALMLYFINSIIWNDSLPLPPMVWCDVASRILFVYNMVIPATSLCISRRLYLMMYNPPSTNPKEDIRLNLKIVASDLATGLLLPFLFMCIQFLVQTRSRFSIYENVGCVQDVVDTPIAQSVIFLSLIFVSVASAVYLGLSVHVFFRKNKDLEAYGHQVSQAQVESVPRVHFYRHASLSFVGILFTFPFSLWRLIQNLIYGRLASISGEALETDYVFAIISTFSVEKWHSDFAQAFSLEISRWIVVCLAIFFFATFAFTAEIQNDYVTLWKNLRNVKLDPRTKFRSLKCSMLKLGRRQSLPQRKPSPIPQIAITTSIDSKVDDKPLPPIASINTESTSVYIAQPILSPASLEKGEGFSQQVPKKPFPLALGPRVASSKVSVATSPSMYSEASAPWINSSPTSEKSENDRSFLSLDSPRGVGYLREVIRSH